MLYWIRIWMVTLFVTVAIPLQAQEWIYCPAAPEELERQCDNSRQAIRETQEQLATIGAQVRNPDIIFARVDRRPEESAIHYKARTLQQQGVATPETNKWLPVLGHYYDPDHQIMYVALDREGYWQYIWEALSPDEDFARRTFMSRERISQQFKQTRYTGPGGKLTQWQQAVDYARRFQQQCCQTLPAAETATTTAILPGEQPRP